MKPTLFTARKQQPVPRWFRWWLSMVGIVLVLGTGFWLLTSRSQIPTQQALQSLADEKELYLQGSLEFEKSNAQSPSAQPIVLGGQFKAIRKGEQNVLELQLHLQLGDAPVTVPLELLQDGQATYYRFLDTGFFTSLIRNATPLDALQLLRMKAVYETKVGQAWLRREQDDSAVPLLVPKTKLQACVSSVLIDPARLQRLFSELIISPTIIAQDSKEVTNVKIQSPKQVLQRLSGNGCQASDIEAPRFTFDVLKPDFRVGSFSIEFTHKIERVKLRASVNNTEVPVIRIPESSVDEAILRQVDAQVEVLVTQQLTHFPELKVIIENLRQFEAEQGSFNP